VPPWHGYGSRRGQATAGLPCQGGRRQPRPPLPCPTLRHVLPLDARAVMGVPRTPGKNPGHASAWTRRRSREQAAWQQTGLTVVSPQANWPLGLPWADPNTVGSVYQPRKRHEAFRARRAVPKATVRRPCEPTSALPPKCSWTVGRRDDILRRGGGQDSSLPQTATRT